ncbi:MAG: DUF58 domain-containing protein [Cytophagales bacterium]|nr:DUF58 domain-containing protein [Cytophagales bacterium]
MKLEEIRRYDNLSLIAKGLIEGFMTGLHRSPYRGFSVEYAEHKMYNPGESTRHIDWRVFQKTDRLYVKQYEEETNLRAYFLLDLSGSMYYPEPDWTKLRYAIYSISSLAYLLERQRDAIGLFGFAEKEELRFPASTSFLHFRRLLDALSPYLDRKRRRQEKTNSVSIFHRIAEELPRRSLVIMFTDVFVPPEDRKDWALALQHLKHQHREVILFHVREERSEIALSMESRMHLFQHAEGTERILIHPEEIRESYQKAILEAETWMTNCCGELKISFLPIRVDEDFDKVFLACLSKREKMV